MERPWGTKLKNLYSNIHVHIHATVWYYFVSISSYRLCATSASKLMNSSRTTSYPMKRSAHHVLYLIVLCLLVWRPLTHPHSCLPWCMNYLRQRFGGRRCFHWCWREQQNHAQVSQLILWYIINFNEIRIQCKILISCAWVYFLQLFHEGTVASLLEASLYYRVCQVEIKNNSTPVLIAIHLWWYIYMYM